MHAFQDLYAHTLRSDDITTIVAVDNFVECERDDYDPRRDGPCHSLEIDDCRGHAAEIGAASEEASIAFFAAFFADLRDGGGARTAAVLDDAFRYQDGCTHDNQYCGTRWYPISLLDKSSVGDAWFLHYGDCSVGRTGAPEWVALILFVSWLARRRSRRAR